jgi:hypothetical protein
MSLINLLHTMHMRTHTDTEFIFTYPCTLPHVLIFDLLAYGAMGILSIQSAQSHLILPVDYSSCSAPLEDCCIYYYYTVQSVRGHTGHKTIRHCSDSVMT